KTTDVLLLKIQAEGLPGPDGVIDARDTPAGLSALWSFAELLRIAAGDELDADPSELQTGLQPFRVGQTETRRIFLADSLENGAGYATHLAHREVMAAVIDRIVMLRRPQLEAEPHAARCDSSCPD